MMKDKELKPYGSGFFYRIPVGIKVGFFKWWIAGAVYFFLGFGSAPELQGTPVHIFSMGAVLGLLNSYVVAPVVRDMTRINPPENPWLTVRRRGPLGTLMNILAGVMLVGLVVLSYVGINSVYTRISGTEGAVLLRVEPILFGVFYLIYEFLWRLLVRVLHTRRGPGQNGT